MRLLIVSAFVLSMGCGNDTAAPPVPMPQQTGLALPVAAPPSAPTTAPVANAPPTTTAIAPSTPVATTAMARFGGTVVPVAGQSVEVIPMADGQIVAYVNDTAGNPVTNGAGATVAVKLGAAQPISLAWQETDLRYSASVTEVQLAPGPVEVTLTQNGQTQTGRVELVPVVQPPAHGGVVLAVGNYSSELLARSDGSIVGYLNGPSGAVTADAGVQFVATVPVATGTPAPVTMTWDPVQSCWVGRVAAEVTIAPGPIEVAVTANGATAQGRFEALAPMPAPEHGGTVVLAGMYGVEVVPAANGEIEAYLKDAQGAAPPPDGFEVTVNFHVGPQPEPVVLVWNASRGRFIGRVRAGVSVERAPVEVFVVNRGRRVRGRLARLWGAPPPPVVRIAGPGIGIAIPPPPVVRVGVQAPPPPVVRVGPPGPPVVRVDVRPPGPPAVGVRVGPPGPPAVGVRVGPPGPPAVRVDVRPPPPPAARGGVQVEIKGRGKRGGVQIRGGGGIRIGN